MINEKEIYLKRLEKALRGIPNRAEIAAEYEAHLDGIIHEEMLHGKSEAEAAAFALSQISSPEEIAASFQQQQGPKKA